MRHKRSAERKPTRLAGYDYSQSGGYFVTICTHDKKQFLSEVNQGQVILTEYGDVVANQWSDLPNYYNHVMLDHFVIMPNHIHGIVVLVDRQQVNEKIQATVGEGLQTFPYKNSDQPKRHGLSEIIRGFKTYSSRRINELRDTKGQPVCNVVFMIELFVMIMNSIVSVSIFCLTLHDGMMTNITVNLNIPSTDPIDSTTADYPNSVSNWL